jgi:hypothetical protein
MRAIGSGSLLLGTFIFSSALARGYYKGSILEEKRLSSIFALSSLACAKVVGFLSLRMKPNYPLKEFTQRRQTTITDGHKHFRI